ncbi:MAG: phosphoribosyltransferase domain-containing protein [Bradymonadia bacterium]
MRSPLNRASHIQSKRIELPNGTLQVTAQPGSVDIDALCGFAARINPKRGFLFVSKVLGRHIPVRVSQMRASHEALAAQLPADLPGPILFFGFAETAIALGYGVFRSYARAHGRDDCMFLHSTRYRFDRPLLAQFSEQHSHATSHYVFGPIEDADTERLCTPKTIVFVDDELTTGRTIQRAAKSLGASFRCVEKVIGAVLTDWGGGARSERPFDIVSLLTGRFHFEPSNSPPPIQMPDVTSRSVYRDHDLLRNDGRFGLFEAIDTRGLESMAPQTEANPVIVLGTGEFVVVPFLLAEAFEARGIDAFVQATTRSPIMLSNDVSDRRTFVDFHGDGMTNFIYNLDAQRFSEIYLCTEFSCSGEARTRLDDVPVIPVDFSQMHM